MGCKVDAIIDLIISILVDPAADPRSRKILVYSQWEDSLTVVAHALKYVRNFFETSLNCGRSCWIVGLLDCWIVGLLDKYDDDNEYDKQWKDGNNHQTYHPIAYYLKYD